MVDGDRPLHLIIVKVAARCNLDCAYCYVFRQDATWRRRPPVMSDATFAATVTRVRRHCERSGQRSVSFSFHGGEPCLVGPARFDAWCMLARKRLAPVVDQVDFVLQTNGTLLDDAWIEVLRRHRVQIGLSMDGPPAIHDANRVDHRGRGSYAAVARGVALLRAAGLPFGILAVIQLGVDPLAVHRHFLALGGRSIAYLLPDYTHETIGPVRRAHGPTPCADYLIPIFDDWWRNGTTAVYVRNFWAMARTILGGESEVDSLGNRPLGFVVVETDGAIEGLDVLRICAEGLAGTGLSVHDADFREIARASRLHGQAIFTGMPLPSGCRACPERWTCGGGYLPHRYSRVRGFDNPSVWCADLLKLFGHVRSRLGVSIDETLLRRRALDELRRDRLPPAG